MTIVILVNSAMQTNTVSKSEFKAKALELFRHIESSGNSLIVTDHGKPVLEVRPYQAAERSPLQVLRESVVRYDQPTEPVGDGDWDVAK
jgi:antitoxin (DNA-binding transcriptional repressor) of toxin-antitoxin stability system